VGDAVEVRVGENVLERPDDRIGSALEVLDVDIKGLAVTNTDRNA
jgi:hypothetical protein